MAYLCQQMETREGDLKRMVGILPATARLNRVPACPLPVEVTLARTNWLGRAGARLRGYRNPTWRLEPDGALGGLVAEPERCLRPGRLFSWRSAASFI